MIYVGNVSKLFLLRTSCLFVSVVPKYVYFAAILTNLLTTFALCFCPVIIRHDTNSRVREV
jgi:hypothetical protein